MSSVCISKCVNDARVPVRATYLNLYKWPESDAEFAKSFRSREASLGGSNTGQARRVVDSISCRQMYLRSYTFSRKETVPEKTRKCIGRVKQRVATGRRRGTRGRSRGGGGMSKVKEVSCAALFAIFHRLLSCAATVDVAE